MSILNFTGFSKTAFQSDYDSVCWHLVCNPVSTILLQLVLKSLGFSLARRASSRRPCGYMVGTLQALCLMIVVLIGLHRVFLCAERFLCMLSLLILGSDGCWGWVLRAEHLPDMWPWLPFPTQQDTRRKAEDASIVPVLQRKPKLREITYLPMVIEWNMVDAPRQMAPLS